MSENSRPVAIRVDSVSKQFKLPHEKNTSIKGALVNVFKKNKTYEIQKAVDNAHFDIHEGDFFGIVGRNGSGKSTLLKMLAGIYSPNHGAIVVNGNLTPFIELGVGFSPELTGRENIYLNGSLLGFNRKEMSAMYNEIVEFAELEEFMDQKLKNYSSGMQVRLAFSIAIRARSDILLIDEVLAVGDALFQKKCFEYFTELKRQKKTVVFVSHDSESLRRFCDHGVLLDKGKQLFLGPINEVVDKYKGLLMKQDALAGKADQDVVEDYKKVNIVSCRTANASGYTTKFAYGETIDIEISLKVNEPVKYLNAAIGVYNGRYEEHADRVFGASTLENKITLDDKTSCIKLSVKKPELRNGYYLIYVMVYGESEEIPYDNKWEICQFKVTGAPKLESRGVVVAEHKWSIT